MEGLQQILPINGMMNQDDNHRYVRSGDGQVIERINLRPNSIDGQRWLNEKIKGNTLIIQDRHGSTIQLPKGNNKCIGWCVDYANNAIIYFIYNEAGNHCIFRYYQKEKSIEKVWYAIFNLGFENSNIRAFIAGGILYWCNGTQKPKSFVVDWAVNYTNGTSIGDGKSYTATQVATINDSILPMIKRPPRWKPGTVYIDKNFSSDGIITVTDINFNNLRRHQFQFKYKYIYLDNQESAYSPISKVPLPPREVSIEGIWDEDLYTNNTIEVTVNTGNSYVKKVVLAVRECQDRTAVGDFYTFYELNKYDSDGNQILTDNTDYVVEFRNTNLLENINTDISNRYFDDVPISASDMLLLDGKYCAMAMPVKNYDLEDVVYTLEAVNTEIDTTALVPANLPFSYNSGNHSYTVTIQWYANSIYEISFTDYDGFNWSYSVNSAAVWPLNANEVAKAFKVLIDADQFNIHHFDGTSVSNNTININFSNHQPKAFSAIVYISGTTGQNVYKSLKRMQYHPFVIIYNDEFGRYNIAQGDQELYSPLEPDCNHTYTVSCKMSIYNQPPISAKTYRIGYIPNRSYTYFLYVPQVEVWDGQNVLITNANDTYVGYRYTIPVGYYGIRINEAIHRMVDAYQGCVIPDYIFSEGDRIRIPCNDYTYEIEKSYEATLTKTGQDNVTVTIFLIRKGTIPFTQVVNQIPIIEIYRPNTGSSAIAGSFNNIFYETGDEYEILDWGTANRRHAGDVDQVLAPLTPAEITLDFGDVYVRGRMGIRLNKTKVSYMVEDMNYTDFFVSSGIDTGRITAKIDSQQKELNSIVRGEQFIEGTKINWLNIFLAQTIHFDASDIYGRITGIEEMGGTLKVIQESKEGSIMIGEVNMKQADAGDFIFIGDAVFGAYRRYEEDRGTVYRRSLISNNRYLYYFDENKGEFIRSSPNGQAPISKEYLMQNWFEKKAKQLRESNQDKDVIVSFDNDYEEVIVNFRIGNTNETMVFSEREGNKGWIRNWNITDNTFSPENFSTYKDTLISFYNGNLYLHNSGVNNTYYNKLRPCSLTATVNAHSFMQKRYSNIKISTDNNLWYLTFWIPEGMNYPEQKSILVPACFREKENMLYSTILRNIINRAGTEDLTLLYDSTRLVGEYMDITFDDSTNEDVNLGMITVNFLIAK